MKKILLIPAIAALAAAPITTLCSCTVNIGPTPVPPQPKGTYKFSFIGHGCTISGESKYEEDVPVGNKNVKFIVLPAPGFTIETPSPTSDINYQMVGDTCVITIANMDKAYSVEINAKMPYQDVPFTIYAAGDLTISINHEGTNQKFLPTIYYSINGEDVGTYYVGTTETIEVHEGDTIQFWSENPNGFSYYDGDDETEEYNFFNIEGEYADIYGNVMSLIYGYNFENETSIPISSGCFDGLFYQSNNICYTDNLVLPAIDLQPYCYYAMFDSSDVYTAPKILPAEKASYGCYEMMFSNCGCIYKGPDIYAKELANFCCCSMFSECIELIAPPTLPATTLAISCYETMFYNCDELVFAPNLPAIELAESCYEGMFKNCSKIISEIYLPATQLAEYCYYEMFKYCPRVSFIKVGFSEWPDEDCTYDWLNETHDTGTFVWRGAEEIERGDSTVPNDWEILTYK